MTFRAFVVGAPLFLLGLMVAAWASALAERRTWPWLVLTLPDDPGDLFMDNRQAGLVAMLCCTLLSGLSLMLMTHWPKWCKLLAMLIGMLSFTAIEPMLVLMEWSGRRDVPFQTGVMVRLASVDVLVRVAVICAMLLPLGAAAMLLTSKHSITRSKGHYGRLRKQMLRGRAQLK